MEKTKQFIKEVYAESKNITWPSRNQTIFFTIAVVAISVLVAYFLGALDVGFSKGLNLILR
jgi:preprotein translocase subunit SecE